MTTEISVSQIEILNSPGFLKGQNVRPLYPDKFRAQVWSPSRNEWISNLDDRFESVLDELDIILENNDKRT